MKWMDFDRISNAGRGLYICAQSATMNLTQFLTNANNIKVSNFFLLLCLTPFVLHSRSVLVHSWGEEDYCSARSGKTSLPEETYVFYPGHFEPGSGGSRLGRKDFDKVCNRLANALEQQNYHILENTDTRQPDLVIVVHWGETTVKRETRTFSLIDPNGEYASLETYFADPGYESINARLLGTEFRMAKRGSNIRKDIARNATNRERYFFILEAYDFPAFQRREKVLQWSTRFSIPSKWLPYETAMEQSMRVAANYFGKQMEDLVLATPSPQTQNAKVEFGEIEVIQGGQ